MLINLIRAILLLACFLVAAPTQAAFLPLEITNIKAAGTGNPAIPSANRIFKAYPGIEYNIRVAVLGGLYPFTYSLSNAPYGMTINKKTGEISWPNPQSNANNITVSVTDSENTTVQATWSITVTTSGFKFVDDVGTNGTGTLASPYNSIANMFAGASRHDIIYFRGGTYQYNGVPGNWVNELNYPYQYVGHPGETATIDMNDHEMANGDPVYYDNLTFIDMDKYGPMIYGGTSYNTIRRCIFNGYTNSDSAHDNQGVITIIGSEGQGYYNVIQDNEIKNWGASAGDAAAIGSIYRARNLVIENNYIHSNTSSNVKGIYPKTETHTYSIRGNKIILNGGDPIFAGPYATHSGNEYAFNLLVQSGARSSGSVLQNVEGPQGNTLFYRNTIISDVYIRIGFAGRGPWAFNNNVISNPNTTGGLYGYMTNYIASEDGTSTFTISNQLANTTASTLVNSANEYKLVAGQSQYVGSRGWQLADGTTPMDATPTITRGGRLSGSLSGGGVMR